MSEQQYQQTPPAQGNESTTPPATGDSQPAPQQSAPSDGGTSAQTIPFQIVKRETGTMHYVDGGARTDLVRHGETGEPEQEYALVATIDGVDVTLSSWNAGRIDTVVAAGKQAQQAQQSQQV